MNSITPEETYTSLKLSDKTKVLYELNGKFSGDLIAGLCVGIILNNEQYFVDNNKLRFEYITVENEKSKLKFYLNAPKTLYDGYVYRNLGYYGDQNEFMFKPEDVGTLLSYYSGYNMYTPLINMWPEMKRYGNYRRWKFSTSEFIRGFITGCNIFNTDYRRFIVIPPSKFVDGKVQKYDIKILE